MKRLPIHHVTFTKKLLKLAFYSVLQIQRTMLLFNLEFILSNNKSRQILKHLTEEKKISPCAVWALVLEEEVYVRIQLNPNEYTEL